MPTTFTQQRSWDLHPTMVVPDCWPLVSAVLAGADEGCCPQYGDPVTLDAAVLEDVSTYWHVCEPDLCHYKSGLFHDTFTVCLVPSSHEELDTYYMVSCMPRQHVQHIGSTISVLSIFFAWAQSASSNQVACLRRLGSMNASVRACCGRAA